MNLTVEAELETLTVRAMTSRPMNVRGMPQLITSGLLTASKTKQKVLVLLGV